MRGSAALPPIKKKSKGKQRKVEGQEAAEDSGKQHLGGACTSEEDHSPMPSEGGSANSLRVFVGRLPQQTTEADLRAHFSRFGAVGDVDMLMRRSNGRFKGAAFVHFESAAGAASALTLDGQEINGKAAAVQPADSGGATTRALAPAAAAGKAKINGKAAAVQPADAGGAPTRAVAPAAAAGKARGPTVDSPAGASSVFVGNLPEGVSEKAVRKVQRHVLILPPPCG